MGRVSCALCVATMHVKKGHLDAFIFVLMPQDRQWRKLCEGRCLSRSVLSLHDFPVMHISHRLHTLGSVVKL